MMTRRLMKKIKSEFVRIVDRLAAQTSLTTTELQMFVEQILGACDITEPNKISIEGFTKIVSTAIGFFEIARSIESGGYEFKPGELDLIRGIVTETNRNIQ